MQRSKMMALTGNGLEVFHLPRLVVVDSSSWARMEKPKDSQKIDEKGVHVTIYMSVNFDIPSEWLQLMLLHPRNR